MVLESRLLINGKELSCLSTSGNKTSVIFIHGNSSGKYAFRKIMESEFAKSHSCFAFDLPGCGASEWLTSADDYLLPELLKFVNDAIEKTGFTNYILAGHSLGGHLALELASSLDSIKGLFIWGTPPLGVSGNGEEPFHQIAELGFLFQEQLKTEEAVLIASKMTLEPGDDRTAILDQLTLSDGKLRTGIAQSIQRGLVPDEIGILKQLNIPICIAHAEKDAFVNKKYLDQFSEYVFEKKIQVIENSGHFPQLEQPNDFLKILEKFIESCH